MPRIYIDDREVEVPDGLNLIEAAKLAGIEIPHFCYHPGLGVDGNCRLCLIEIDGVPKPQIACNTFVKEGLRIRASSERVKELRRAVLEFFFLNHPLDCPICDQSGECLLQDFYMRHGQYESRLDLPKVHKRKVVDVGPRVVLDAERCVLCARCVRFCDQVPKTGELRIANRGNHSEITVHPDKPLENPYSLNTVDLCPVGALTSTDFRFKCRVWFLSSARSICAGCARGCNVYLEHNAGEAYRLRPRENMDVNTYWMCDDGRLTYKRLNDGRCEAPLLGGVESTHPQAVAELAGKLSGADPESILFVLSPEMSNESLYAARKFAAQAIGARRVVAASRKLPGIEDEILRKADANPNRRGCEVLGLWSDDLTDELARGGKLVILVQNDLLDHAPELAPRLAGFETVVALATNHCKTTAAASIVLPVTPHSECDGTFTNFQGRVQRFRRAMTPRGDAMNVAETLRRVAAAMGREFGWVNLNEIWREMAAEVEELSGMSPEAIGDQGMLLRSLRPAKDRSTEGEG